MPKKISIIGSGWLAQPLARRWMNSGHQVQLTTTQQDKADQLQHDGFEATVFQLGRDEMPAALKACDVMVFAITAKEPAAFKQLIGSLNPEQTRHIIYISSTSVYANSPKPQDETSQDLNHENPILAIEQNIQAHPKSSIIRFAGLVGPGRHPGRFFANGKVISKPLARVNLIHLDDCLGIIDAVIQQQAWGHVFNGCADNHPTKGEFYTAMAQQLGRPAPALGDPKTQDHNSTDKIICNDRVKQQLNYCFKFPDVMTFTYS